MKNSFPIVSVASLLIAAGLSASATAGIINFDSLPASGQAVNGAALSSYLAGFGVSVSALTPGTSVDVLDVRDIYPDTQPIIPPSPFNIIGQQGSDGPISYEVDFALPQPSFSVTRAGFHSGQFGLALPEWQATAYDATNHVLSSVGESATSIFSDIPDQVFTLNGPAIDHVIISSDANNFAAFGSVSLDDFNVPLTPAPAPEPGSLALLCIGISVCLAWRRCRRAGPACRLAPEG